MPTYIKCGNLFLVNGTHLAQILSVATQKFTKKK